ncbi:pilus assembly protein CpaC [Pseudidiomarina planktonica]|uniref:Pilus assembly protein CpaC n=1 Tax=Pseudidiomarina planktonica TaxID=1323738 RepID=A0A1Y6EP74_9GAMM|nr:hypothetical protein [Pseudidiomarina planktonica]RUO65614.1 hypothetical protein CWI77_03955 [Pseudidiomarina planktonica]SMQ64099.1 pilus assembly protein CpaC [Pseudidiomarina planktonica]
MKNLLFCLLIIGAGLSVSKTVDAQDSTTRSLLVNSMTLIDVSGAEEIVVGAGDAINTELINDKHLVVRGVSVGVASIVLLGTDGTQTTLNFDVRAHVPERLLLELQAIRLGETDLTIESLDQFVMVTGEVGVEGLKRLKELEDKYPQLLVHALPVEPSHPMIEISVKILELKKQWAEQLGLRWDSAVAGPSVSRIAGTNLQFPLQLNSQLQLLQRQGRARLLAEPRLVTQSGSAARFLAGGEIPLPQVVGQGGQDVSFREYGIRLEITPVLMSDGLLKTSVSAEVSHIDGAVSVNGIPGILTRKTASIVVAESGEAITISGLLTDDSSTSLDRFPWLAEIPILGGLFESHDFQRQQTELVVIVTPQLASTRSASEQKIKDAQNDLIRFHQQVQCVGVME